MVSARPGHPQPQWIARLLDGGDGSPEAHFEEGGAVDSRDGVADLDTEALSLADGSRRRRLECGNESRRIEGIGLIVHRRLECHVHWSVNEVEIEVDVACHPSGKRLYRTFCSLLFETSD